MRYQPISADFYQGRRQAFSSEMEKNSAAFLCSNDVHHTNLDDVMQFVQQSDLFYLTGIDQPKTLLLLYPNARLAENREILFIERMDDHAALWDGEKLTKEKVTELSGISRVEWIDDLGRLLDTFLFEAEVLYLPHNEHKKRATREQQTQEDRWISWFTEKYPLHHRNRVASITGKLRMIKQAEEVEQIKRCVSIGTEAFKKVLKTARSGMFEYEAEAELIHTIVKNGGTRHAFLPIVASGKNACVLHYNSNNHKCEDGEMILLDFGVRYGNYHSDTTRCFPVNGRFTDRQKEVYSAVLHCLKEGSKWLKPGVHHAAYELNMAQLVEEQLIKLGLITEEEVKNQAPEKPIYKRYFMHGTAHHLGLDVHDVGSYDIHFEPGMVLTCEPGIYIPEEGIGCRLENDLLITEDGHVNLSADMPLEIEEIENLMNA